MTLFINACVRKNSRTRRLADCLLKKLDEPKFILASTDIGSYKEFTSTDALSRCNDPGDAFALHKAALVACGVIPRKGDVALEDICGHLGGGLYMNTRVINIPKGSGLGTSSILAAACIKGLSEFLELPLDENALYSRVLCMEQLMSTGGGWQDQVGGLSYGIKLATAAPGLEQKIQCTPVAMTEEAKQELKDRFALIYTGQRRLARNLLRDVVGRYVGNEPDSLYALNEIQRVAALMRFELERGRIDEFAKLLNYHWELSLKVDAGSTNTLIDHIFSSIEDLIDGKMICGAGGGGFLQVILKKNVTKEAVHNRLKEVFEDNDIDIWDSALI